MPQHLETATPVARLRDVQLRYGAAQALRGITLDIPTGRMVGLIGPDGVGKSSLLALMAAFGSDAGPAQRQSPDDSAMAPLS